LPEKRGFVVDLALAIDHLLGAPPELVETGSMAAWWTRHTSTAAGWRSPIERALITGFAADRPGYAFASGLQEALASLLGRAADRTRALCATEEGGAHPRAIRSTLTPTEDGWRLDGGKRWVSLGGFASELLVVAREPARDGDVRPRLALVCVPASRRGVRVEPMPATRFIPEVPHGAATFEAVDVRADERLPGDGYARYLKPFRTVEDCFVHAALVAWWIQVGRRCGWPKEQVEQLAELALGFGCLALAEPTSIGVHRVLGALLTRTGAQLEALARSGLALDPEARQRWARDQPLMNVAAGARAQRLEVARAYRWPLLRGF